MSTAESIWDLISSGDLFEQEKVKDLPGERQLTFNGKQTAFSSFTYRTAGLGTRNLEENNERRGATRVAANSIVDRRQVLWIGC